LLRDPGAVLKKLIVRDSDRLHDLKPQQCFALIKPSLIVNKTLKFLRIGWGLDNIADEFADIICDVSSIESIHNSNHSLREIRIGNQIQYTDMNENANKTKFIRKKIAKYYFRGDFKTTPFASMSISLMPSVLEMITGSKANRLSAIYRLLKCISDLCEVSSRDPKKLAGGSSQQCFS
jgi:hypothetical protein